MKYLTRDIALEVFMRFCVAIFFLNTMLITARDYLATGRLSTALFAIYLLHFAIFALIRRFPKDVTKRPVEWLVAIIGTSMMAFFVPSSTELVPHAVILQSVGMCITFLGLLSLNRSYAIVPSNRGIKTTGMYRFMRHPLYAGYIIADVGLILSQFSWNNLLIVFLAVAFLLYRIRFEENFLRQDPNYIEFCNKTRYRIIPYIW